MDSNSIDVVDNGAIVKVFLLEAALPSNAGDDILNAAGGFWGSYALTHAALGFLVEETETKKVLDFFAVNYVGAFLPDVAPPPPSPTPAPSTPAPTPSSTPTPSTPSPSTPPPTLPPTPAPMGGNATNVPTSVPATPLPTTAVPTTPLPTTAVPTTPLPTTTAPATTTAPGTTTAPAATTTAPVTPVPTTPSPTVAGKGGENSRGSYDVRRLSRQAEQQLNGNDGGGGESGGAWRVGRGVRSGNGTTGVAWDNAAELMPESGFDEGKWLSANYVAKITGLLYNDLTGWANTYWKDHPVYQPLSACGSGGAEGDFATMGSADSYDFVWAAFERLASNGVIFEQQVVLPPKRTAMCLFPEGGIEAVDMVEAAGNEEVEEYYREVGECVRDLAAAAAAGNSTYPGPACASSHNGGGGGGGGWAGEGGVSFLLGLENCLEGQSNAYLYHNTTSYLRLPLPTGANTTAEAVLAEAGGGGGVGGGGSGAVAGVAGVSTRTARLVRYAPAMPERPPTPPGGSDRAYIVYIAVGLAAFGLAVAGLRMLYRRRKDSLAYGRGGGGGDGGAHGGIFSSSAGAGWRSGGGVASDFGDFDTIGGSYEGALFPADNYSSGNLSGSRSHGGGRLGGWRGSGRGPSEPGNAGAENVELKRPLLNQADSHMVPEGHQAPAATSSRPTGSSRGGASGAGGDDAGDSRRQRGAGARGGGGGGGRGRDREGGHSDNRAGLSPPPFSRILGTMGGGPPSSGGKSNTNLSSGGGGGGGAIGRGGPSSQGRPKTRGGGGGGGGGGEEEDALDKGPFGGDDGGEELFVGGGGGGGRGTRSLKRDNGPDGDEVFC